MSLVLNTNTSWWWAYQLSNSDIWVSYPQFENNCILFAQVSLENWNEIQTAYSVNWTAVNFITWVLEAPWCFQIADYTWAADHIPWWYYIWNINTLPSNTIRIWTREAVSAWLTIWKTVVFPQLLQRSANSSVNRLSSITYKVWLLHSDWTISYIATKTITSGTMQYINMFPSTWDWSVWKSFSSYYYKNFWYTNEVSRTNWIVSQEWDYIIAEIVLPSDEYATFNWYLFFWTVVPYWNILTTTNRVFQISID